MFKMVSISMGIKMGMYFSKIYLFVFAFMLPWIHHVHASFSRSDISSGAPIIKPNSYPSLFVTSEGTVLKLFPEGRDYICDSAQKSLFEDRTLYPYGNCIADELAKTNENERIMIHIIWRGVVTTSLYATLDSLLVTQNMSAMQIRLWLSGYNSCNSFQKPEEKITSSFISNHSNATFSATPNSTGIRYRIQICESSMEALRYRYKSIIEGDYLVINTTSWKDIIMSSYLHEKHPNWSYESIPPDYLATISIYDILRLAILHEYGGIYLDEDVLTTRDLSPYVKSNCEWMAAHADTAQYYNNHVVVLKAHSKTAKFLLNAIPLFPWNEPDLWPVTPVTKLHAWVYNDGLSQYCIRFPETCKLCRLPMFLVDHHLHNLCKLQNVSGFDHYPGCLDVKGSVSSGNKTHVKQHYHNFSHIPHGNTITLLLASLRLSTLHRHVPHKGKCEYDAYSLKLPLWDNPDSILFHIIKEFVKCDSNAHQVCLGDIQKILPRTLHSLLVDYIISN